MTTDFATRSTEEARTHELLQKIWSNADCTQAEIIIASVFKAMWSSALPVERVEKIGCAMFGYEKLDLQETLTAMARSHILRSRMSGGRRFYEVNF